MDGKIRREMLLEKLKESSQPVSAGALARQLGVSRQIIVGDVALLRSAGEEIAATPRGYVLQSREEPGLRRQVACRHTARETGDELYAMVDNGCTVVDVIVEHPVYGQLTGILGVSSRYDVKEFVRRVETDGARPLSDLTGGIHLHTIRCRDEKSFQRVQKALANEGFLLDM